MPHSTEWEGPRIVLNSTVRPRLERKLDEYRLRLRKAQSVTDDRAFLPPEERTDIIDATMKIAVLARLLRDGVVNILALSQELLHEPHWSPEVFENACVVIDAYNADAAGTLAHGTGLPES